MERVVIYNNFFACLGISLPAHDKRLVLNREKAGLVAPGCDQRIQAETSTSVRVVKYSEVT